MWIAEKRKLDKLPTEERTTLKWPGKDKFLQFLLENHQIFALDEAERGEINLVQITINTGEAQPKQVLPLRTSLAAGKKLLPN